MANGSEKRHKNFNLSLKRASEEVKKVVSTLVADLNLDEQSNQPIELTLR